MKRALFLDRDGVINIDKHHVFRIEDIEFVDGIFDIVAEANSADLLVIIVTNQAGIARGIYSEDDFWCLMNWMVQIFKKRNAIIDAVYFCPIHPDYPHHERDQKYSGWRKPDCGMILAAASEHKIDLGNSFLIGDRDTDAQAAIRAGIPNILLLNPSGPEISEVKSVECVKVTSNLKEALVWLRENTKAVRPANLQNG